MKLAIVRFAIVMAVVLPAAPLAAEGQQAAKIPRVGLIVVSRIWEEAFLAGLQDAGYLVGKNILLERRYSNGRNEQFPAMVREVLALNVDVLVAASGPAIAAAKTATQTVPIVGIDLEVDPVASGYAASLARPGGNLTGVFLDMPEERQAARASQRNYSPCDQDCDPVGPLCRRPAISRGPGRGARCAALG